MLGRVKIWNVFGGTRNVIDAIPDTFVSEKTTFEGESLSGIESIRVDGSLKCNVDISACFIVGVSGTVDGNIKSNDVIIAGEVNGNIHAENKVHLTSTAKVTGEIMSNSIIIDEGAILNGSVGTVRIEDEFTFKPIRRFAIQEGYTGE